MAFSTAQLAPAPRHQRCGSVRGTSRHQQAVSCRTRHLLHACPLRTCARWKNQHTGWQHFGYRRPIQAMGPAGMLGRFQASTRPQGALPGAAVLRCCAARPAASRSQLLAAAARATCLIRAGALGNHCSHPRGSGQPCLSAPPLIPPPALPHIPQQGSLSREETRFAMPCQACTGGTCW